MNKYTSKSDFEINKNVALHVGGLALSLTVVNDEHKTSGNIGNFDPCNNPSDAWDIIIENRINLRTVDGYMDWYADHPTNSRIYSHNINPLRAAMEVFLMMRDEENENDRI